MGSENGGSLHAHRFSVSYHCGEHVLLQSGAVYQAIAENTDRMSLIDYDTRLVLFGKLRNGSERSKIAVH
ncbi:hypothetical protein D3C72_2527010 [compost metagenome]